MNDLIKIEKPQLPEKWDYDKSIKKVKSVIYKWGKITQELLGELWIARKILSSQGKRTDLVANATKSKTWNQYCEDISVDRSTIHRWLVAFETSNPLVSKFTGEQENYTPSEVIDSVKEVLGNIDLDPASCDFAQEIVQANEFFTEEDNGLSKSWHGNVFINPPYQMPKIREFTNKLIEELPNITAAILLTNNGTDTLWFHKCAEYSKLICFTKGRINFHTKNIERTQPTNGQAFFYFGNDEEKFIRVFSEIGLIVRRVNGGKYDSPREEANEVSAYSP